MYTIKRPTKHFTDGVLTSVSFAVCIHENGNGMTREGTVDLEAYALDPAGAIKDAALSLAKDMVAVPEPVKTEDKAEVEVSVTKKDVTDRKKEYEAEVAAKEAAGRESEEVLVTDAEK